MHFGSWSDDETLMQEKFRKDLTPYRVKYRTLKRKLFLYNPSMPDGEAEVVKTALSLWSPEVSNLFYECTGGLTFFTDVVAMVYIVRMILVRHGSDKLNAQLSRQSLQ